MGHSWDSSALEISPGLGGFRCPHFCVWPLFGALGCPPYASAAGQPGLLTCLRQSSSRASSSVQASMHDLLGLLRQESLTMSKTKLSIHSKGQFHPGPKSYRHSRTPSLFSHSSWNPSSKFCQLYLKKIYPESNALLITSFLPLGQGYHHLSPELLHWTLTGFPAAILTPLVYFQPISPSTAIKILIGLYHSSP